MKTSNKHRFSFLDFCVCLVFFTTPLESVGFSEESSAISIVKLVAVLLLFAWLFFSPRRLDFSSTTKLFVFLGGYWLLSCIWAIDLENSLSNLLSFYFPSVIVMMIIGGSISCKQDIINISGAYLLGSIVLAVFCCINRDAIIADASYADMERVTALGQDPNELSFLLVMGLVVALNGVRECKNKIIKAMLLCSAFLLVYSILLTGSRTGLLMTVFVIALFLWNNIGYAILALPVVLLLGHYLLSLVPEGTISRLMNISQDLRAGNLSSREDIWRAGLTAYYEENTVLGVGYQNFVPMLKKHFGLSLVSHNTYLSYLITGGFGGIALLLVILANLFSHCRKLARKTHSSYWYAYIAPLFIVMLTLETQYRRWIFLLSIVLYKLCEISQREDSPN